MTNPVKVSVVEYRCESCGKILAGYDKLILKNENYLSVKGKLALQLWDEDTKKRYYCNILPEDKPLLTVCDLTCLQKYIDFQYIQFQNKRDRFLRHQAEMEAEDRKKPFIPRFKFEKRPENPLYPKY